jgi:hypothetical protein
MSIHKLQFRDTLNLEKNEDTACLAYMKSYKLQFQCSLHS